MPLINSTYKAPKFLLTGDMETIFPFLFRKVKGIYYQRERIVTPDDDFLDLDWVKGGNKRLAIINHGLEGSSDASYVLGMVKALGLDKWDTLAWNYRGCSGEINKQFRFYHSGETTDLHFVIQYVLSQNRYEEIALIGFSIGGNITLKYLGEQGKRLCSLIKKAVTFSVPCHLESGAKQLARWRSKIYMNRFLTSLYNKVKEKSLCMPDKLSIEGFNKIKNFEDFDEKYTAPIHGYKSALEYWTKNSSIFYLKDIAIPTLIVNAKNDPFLAPQCYPVEEAKENLNLFLEIPEQGGHVGFYHFSNNGLYWSEQRALQFISGH